MAAIETVESLGDALDNARLQCIAQVSPRYCQGPWVITHFGGAMVCKLRKLQLSRKFRQSWAGAGGIWIAMANQLDGCFGSRYESSGTFWRQSNEEASAQVVRTHGQQRLPNPIDVHVGARIRLRRTLLGMSQTAVAETIGLTFQQVQKYEKGTNRVSSSRLFDLANALDVSVPYFFDEMSAAVQGQTPAMLMDTRKLAKADDEKDPMAKRETLGLVRAYYRITGPAVRMRLLELTKVIAKLSN